MTSAEKLARQLFSDEGLAAAGDAIKEFESRTSGEIVISFNTRDYGQPYKRAMRIFKSQKLHRTKLRNAVLIALFLEDRSFAIYGDKGIHDRLPADYWDNAVKEMSEHFKSENLADGLVWAIRELGHQLVEYFPYEHDDEDELSNELHFGED